mmetsp:Transcript_43550/g.81835  ORF Transcript_43550/g.81835 Transcript_43550/m.81835 type:complete len:169 (+) Transcript_43550:121-627(+)
MPKRRHGGDNAGSHSPMPKEKKAKHEREKTEKHDKKGKQDKQQNSREGKESAPVAEVPVLSLSSKGGSAPTATNVDAAAAAPEKSRPEKRAKKERDPAEDQEKVVNKLVDGSIGYAVPTRMLQPGRGLALRLLTGHKSVAWQWLVNGRMHYPIPIGASRPLSPTSSDE